MNGLCPCCSSKILVRDSNGKYNSFKSNYRQADLIYENGTRLRVALCKDCLCEEPDLSEIIEVVASQSSRGEKIRMLGTPVSMVLASNTKQGKHIRER